MMFVGEPVFGLAEAVMPRVASVITKAGSVVIDAGKMVGVLKTSKEPERELKESVHSEVKEFFLKDSVSMKAPLHLESVCLWTFYQQYLILLSLLVG